MARLMSPITENDWSRAAALIAELQEWDVRQCRALGFAGDEVLKVFYPDDMQSIRAHSRPPDGCFLLAVDESSAVGCAAIHRMTASACELYDVYVRPTSRGGGVASMLVRQLMVEARAAGYLTMRLETAVFMRSAHKIYRALQFQERDPYREVPAKFTAATFWMECKLAEGVGCGTMPSTHRGD